MFQYGGDDMEDPMHPLDYYCIDDDIVYLGSTIYSDHILTVIASHPEIVA